MQQSFVEIAHACASDAPVLISGPTGTGKTLTARVIHANSSRQDGPFVTLHCALAPGDAAGERAFRPREKRLHRRPRRAARAHRARHGGTLFLDEIADISPRHPGQAPALRRGEAFTRVGGREDLHVDLRLITATNKDLRDEVARRPFPRGSLLPPARPRNRAAAAVRAPGGYPCALRRFPRHHRARPPPQLSRMPWPLLCEYRWPGNVRELRNVLEHAAAVSSGAVIFPQHLPRELRSPPGPPLRPRGLETPSRVAGRQSARRRELPRKCTTASRRCPPRAARAASTASRPSSPAP